MTWHYAAGGEQPGPVDDAELDRLIAAGVVTGETLVWRPAGRLAAAARGAPAALLAGPRSAPRELAPFTPAASTAPRGRAPTSRPSSRAPPGAAPGAVSATRRGLAPRVRARVDHRHQRADHWRDDRRRLRPLHRQHRPARRDGPLTAAWVRYFLRQIRGQAAEHGRRVRGLLVAGIPVLHDRDQPIVTALAVLLLVPFFSAVFFTMIGTVAATAAADEADAPAVLDGPAGAPPDPRVPARLRGMLYLTMAFMFAPLLVHDRGHAFWPAMRRSQRVVQPACCCRCSGCCCSRSSSGSPACLALCLGIFVAMPVITASFAYAYEDLFGETGAARPRLPHGPRLGEQVGRGAAGRRVARARRPPGAGAQRGREGAGTAAGRPAPGPGPTRSRRCRRRAIRATARCSRKRSPISTPSARARARWPVHTNAPAETLPGRSQQSRVG